MNCGTQRTVILLQEWKYVRRLQILMMLRQDTWGKVAGESTECYSKMSCVSFLISKFLSLKYNSYIKFIYWKYVTQRFEYIYELSLLPNSRVFSTPQNRRPTSGPSSWLPAFGNHKSTFCLYTFVPSSPSPPKPVLFFQTWARDSILLHVLAAGETPALL